MILKDSDISFVGFFGFCCEFLLFQGIYFEEYSISEVEEPPKDVGNEQLSKNGITHIYTSAQSG